MHRRIRRGSIATLISIAALGLSACGDDNSGSGSSGSGATTGQAAKDLRIGEVFYSADPYQVALKGWMERAAKEQGFQLKTCIQNTKPQSGVECVRDWTTQKLDGIIYAPVDPAAAVAPTREAQQAGIPVVAVATKPNVNLPFADTNEKAQTVAAGKAAAEQVKELFPGEKVGVLVLDLPNLPICKERRMGGFIEGVKSVDPDATITAVDGKGDRLSSRTVTADTIQSGKRFNIVTACTGEMIQGALSALKSAGRAKASGKKPATEYVFAIDGDKLQMEQLLDPKSPVMQVMGLTPKENSEKTIALLMEAIEKKIPVDATKTVDLTSKLIDSDCTAVNEYLEVQYFAEPIPCT